MTEYLNNHDGWWFIIINVKNVIHINTVDGYIKLIIDLQNQYANDSSYSMFDNMVYRGLNNKIHALLPTLFRNSYDNLEKKYFYHSHKDNLDDCILKLKTDFANHEQLIIDDFRREALRYLPKYANNEEFSIVELAQHYGVPTRLLDWTSNPLVALYFACAKSHDQDGAVWMLNKNKYVKFSDYQDIKMFSVNEIFNMVSNKKSDYRIEMPVLLMPNYFDERMAAQASVFMMWGHIRKPLEKMFADDNYMFYDPAFTDNYIKQKRELNQKRFVYKVIIPAQNKGKLLNQLQMLGIDEAFVYPGLEGIGKLIKSKYGHSFLSINRKEYTFQAIE